MKLSLRTLFLTTRNLVLGLAFLGTILLTQGCSSSPGSASQYESPFVNYVGPGYGGGPSGDDGYASGVPSVAGKNVDAWYGETRP